MVLLIPVNKLTQQLNYRTSITLELFKPKVTTKQPENTDPIKPIPTNNIEEKLNSSAKPILAKKPKPVETLPQSIQDPVVRKLPSSGEIFNLSYGKVKLYKLDKYFQARTADSVDFKFKQIQQPKWNKVTKLIDEEVDKPKSHMNFYSEGIVGATERFFDKISYSKKFTTRYGTKIYCGGVGPLVMCSWK